LAPLQFALMGIDLNNPTVVEQVVPLFGVNLNATSGGVESIVSLLTDGNYLYVVSVRCVTPSAENNFYCSQQEASASLEANFQIYRFHLDHFPNEEADVYTNPFPCAQIWDNPPVVVDMGSGFVYWTCRNSGVGFSLTRVAMPGFKSDLCSPKLFNLVNPEFEYAALATPINQPTTMYFGLSDYVNSTPSAQYVGWLDLNSVDFVSSCVPNNNKSSDNLWYVWLLIVFALIIAIGIGYALYAEYFRRRRHHPPDSLLDHHSTNYASVALPDTADKNAQQ